MHYFCPSDQNLLSVPWTPYTGPQYDFHPHCHEISEINANRKSYCHVVPVVPNSCHEPHIPRSLPVTIIKTSKKAKTFLKTSIKTMTPAHMWNINKAGQCWAPVS